MNKEKFFRLVGGVVATTFFITNSVLAAPLASALRPTAAASQVAASMQKELNTVIQSKTSSTEEILPNLSVSLGGVKIAVNAVNAKGTLLLGESVSVKWAEALGISVDTPGFWDKENADRFTDLIADLIEEALQRLPVSINDVGEIGISNAGPVEEGYAGKPDKCPNTPLENYPLIEELKARIAKRLGRENVPFELINDCRAALKGERSPKGLLYDAEIKQPIPGCVMIVGGGINIDADDPRVVELGHQLILTKNLPKRYNLSKGRYTHVGLTTKGRHPQDNEGNYFQGDLEDRCSGPELAKRFAQLLIEGTNADIHYIRGKIEKGLLGDFELMQRLREAIKDVSVKNALRLLTEKGLTKEQEKMKPTIATLVLNSITKAALDDNHLAKEWIEEVGTEIGQALAAFIADYKDEPFVKHIILVSGVNENLGKGVVDEAGRDLYVGTIQDAVRGELTTSYKDEVDQAEVPQLVSGIVRSELTFQRELIAFAPEAPEGSDIKSSSAGRGDRAFSDLPKELDDREGIEVFGRSKLATEGVDIILADDLMFVMSNMDVKRTDTVSSVLAKLKKEGTVFEKSGKTFIETMAGEVPVDKTVRNTIKYVIGELTTKGKRSAKSSSAGTFTGLLFDTGHKIAAREGVEFTPLAETPRTAAEVRELLKQAKKPLVISQLTVYVNNRPVGALFGKDQKPLVIKAHLRGMDLCGSSLDLPEFQYSLTDQGVMEIKDIPSTPTLASEFSVTIRFELAKDPDVIEYIAPDYGITEDNPYIVKGRIELKDGKVPGGQRAAPAYIFANIFGLSGVRIICESISPMAMAGGMESSNAFNVALYAAASMLSGRNWTLADIFADSVRLENKELAGLTGGQGHLSSILGGAYHHIWQSGIKDAEGKRINPYSAFSVPFIKPEDFSFVEEHMALAQAGKEYEDGKAVIGRTAALINFMWTDLLREKDPQGVKLHREKLGLTARYINAVRNKDMKTAVECINRYVEIRDQLCVRWAECVVKKGKTDWLHRLERGDREVVATYGLDEAKATGLLAELIGSSDEALTVFALENLQTLYEKKISLYSDTAKDLINAARAEGIAVMPLGAGGPGAILGVVSSKGQKHLEEFFKAQELPLLTDDSVRTIIHGTGTLKGYMPFKIGKEPIQFEGFKELGLQEPALPVPAVYDEQTTKFATPSAKSSSAGTLNLDDIKSLTPQALERAITLAKTEDVKRILIQSKLAAEVSKLDVSGTIVFNDEPLSTEQHKILKSILGKNTPSLQELENLMNCTIRLKSELTPNDIKGELIIVSDTKLESFPDAKYLMFEQKVKLDNIYLPVVPMIAMAKGLLALKDMNQIELINSIKELSRSLCKKPLQDEIIETYIQNGIFNLELPKPEAYDYKKLEYMQRQALAALIAA